MTTLSQAKQRLLNAGFDCQGDGGGGYEIYQAQIRIGRVYSDQELIGWQPPTVLVGIPMMDQAEARATVDAIKGHLDSARKLLVDLEEREGWKALGYSSWRACAQAEFGQSSAQVYRLLTAAKIEQAIDSPIGENPESHLRPLTMLDTPVEQRQALDRATEIAGDRPRTAKDVQTAVAEIKPPTLSAEEQQHAKEVRALLKELPVWHESIQPQVIKDAYKHVCKIRGGALRIALIAEIAAAEQSLTVVTEAIPVIVADPATEAEIKRLCAICGARYVGLALDRGVLDGTRYRIFYGDRPPHLGGGDYLADEALAKLHELCKAKETPPATDDRRPNDRAAYEAREAADQVLLDDASAAITEGCYADARALLAGIEVKTVARDLVRARLITVAAQRFVDDQRTRLARYSPAALVSQADHKLALDHIAALLDREAAQ